MSPSNSDASASREARPQTTPGPISAFVNQHFLHFNAAALVDAADGYAGHLDKGGKMMVTLAGAMSTAEMGKMLAEMIRQDKIHIISCTGANLEEDVMNLVAHNDYVRLPHYRDLSPQEEWDLAERGMNRVTDTCIPEDTAIRRMEEVIFPLWQEATQNGQRRLPHEYLYDALLSGALEPHYQIDPANSWMLAAAEHGIPIICPGWEDSTLGNIFAGYCLAGECNPSAVKSGIEYMMMLAEWYRENTQAPGIGFFQIGGGIAGDFPICVVPMLRQDRAEEDIPFWAYFCQISDSTTSYGSYSGAVPNEKISWGKLAIDTPRYVIESDATIVAPLIFAKVLGW